MKHKNRSWALAGGGSARQCGSSGIILVVMIIALLVGCAREQRRTRTGDVPTGSPAETSSTSLSAATATQAIGLPNVGPLFEPTPPPQVYIVQSGDTLTGIASRFGCTVQALMEANQITNPNLLQLGQKLQIPAVQAEVGPSAILLPDSEFVNGPAYVDFDIGAFCARQESWLIKYSESVSGQLLSGPEIVSLVAHRFSLGPRLLLAILEVQGGWVTSANPTGPAFSYSTLAKMADQLNKGYYDWRGRGVTVMTWIDGTATRYAPTLNAATAGLQYFFSLHATKSEWQRLVGTGPGSFLETYRRLFGDPTQYAVEPLIPADTANPSLVLPWPTGEMWYYVGGPHGGWGDGSAWSALDFVPDEGYLGCQTAASWATAAAPGLIIYSQDGQVLIDLDEDGQEETGWVLFYLHVASEGRVPVGTRVRAGDRIGHPSCEGGFAEATHLHLARKYNGEWIAADGPLPMILSGWQAHSGGAPYEGTLTRGREVRTSCECWEAEYNGLVREE
ncbi:MAG: LysM peptidoglycan-binding domain-containing protein [Anaerolineae bacterium]